MIFFIKNWFFFAVGFFQVTLFFVEKSLTPVEPFERFCEAFRQPSRQRIPQEDREAILLQPFTEIDGDV